MLKRLMLKNIKSLHKKNEMNICFCPMKIPRERERERATGCPSNHSTIGKGKILREKKIRRHSKNKFCSRNVSFPRKWNLKIYQVPDKFLTKHIQTLFS